MSKILVVLLLVSHVFVFANANVDISKSIVGGHNASPGQFPFMVSYQYKGYRGSHICGGGIINERWILTAAHCLMRFKPNETVVSVGSVLIDGGTFYNVEEQIRHPHYIEHFPPFFTSNWNDIGLIKTAASIIFNEFIQSIPLGRRHIIGPVTAILAGFGAYFTNITITPMPEKLVMSRYLQFMNTRIITNNECSLRTNILNLIEPNFPVKPIIHPLSNVCTLQPIGTGSCFGDSGSLLISNSQAVGIVVSGVRPCAHGAPDIYTRISSFISWIERYIRDV